MGNTPLTKSPAARITSPIRPHSRPGKLAVIDGRRAEAKRMKGIREDLAEHLGGKPSAAQRLLIGRVAVLLLRMELFDKDCLHGDMSERQHRYYVSWHNAASRSLQALGLAAALERPKSVDEQLTEIWGQL